MSTSVIDLRLFSPRYRQMLLFAMIEGLIAGEEFSFLDDRDPSEIEEELKASGLTGYTWTRSAMEAGSGAAYRIQRGCGSDSAR